MEPTLTVVGEEQPKEEPNEKTPRLWRERQLSADELFQSVNEVGRSGWFFRVEITGMFPRRVGPFKTQSAALDCYEEFIAGIFVEPLCALENAHGDGELVVEGVPRLTRQAHMRGRRSKIDVPSNKGGAL